jgi:hypothetical protein
VGTACAMMMMTMTMMMMTMRRRRRRICEGTLALVRVQPCFDFLLLCGFTFTKAFKNCSFYTQLNKTLTHLQTFIKKEKKSIQIADFIHNKTETLKLTHKLLFSREQQPITVQQLIHNSLSLSHTQAHFFYTVLEQPLSTLKSWSSNPVRVKHMNIYHHNN